MGERIEAGQQTSGTGWSVAFAPGRGNKKLLPADARKASGVTVRGLRALIRVRGNSEYNRNRFSLVRAVSGCRTGVAFRRCRRLLAGIHQVAQLLARLEVRDPLCRNI